MTEPTEEEEIIALLGDRQFRAMPFDAAVAVQYRAAADALEAQARKSSCCVMRVRRLVLRVSAMFTWPSVGLIGVT